MPYYLGRGTRNEQDVRKYQTAGSCKGAAEDFLRDWQMRWARRYSSEAFEAVGEALERLEKIDPSTGTELHPVGLEVPLSDTGIILCLAMWQSY